ncbi:cell elongation-specific peptidoglycan biosynthesis regulator RodA [Caldanaerobius fijiensis DSM 17918]|uniref:Peptidoglycan glycosyltransferase RodA n=1 Tax=Caldanaerobius fijiensis DSM 17918 TaxID=1121256 RepID=A0A1M4YAL5_9THEO|nr:rod shape-determining protein RodA [Caldanaerobius fijiensis]SHF02663.1 cell elongation-specific peptidoglycan biosynthesis regulator RodA [Caldanaerobius fijiensis DSM 17918]
MDKRLVKNIDFILIATVIIISILGIIAISSATHVANGGSAKNVILQSVWLIISLVTAFLIMKIDYNLLGNYYKVIYIISIALLLVTLAIGSSTNGAKSWVKIGGISFQFSEITKVAFIISLAKLLELKRDKINNVYELFKILVFTGIPILLILKQNDTGTALVFIAIFLGMLFISGINIWYIVSFFVIGVVSAPVVFKYFLQDYQKKRILTFLNPNLDKMGAGYHVFQSKIAIGSGQITGFGLYKGSQVQFNFLPEASTDFIYSVVGQELGFIGTITILVLYFVMLLRLIKIAMVSKDSFGSLIVAGIISMFLFHIFENIGMTIGLMPVTGIPLPFMSYGGSSLFANFVAIGLALNVGMRRQKIKF